MPWLIPNHIFKIHGHPKVLTSTTIFNKCGVKANSGRREYYTLKTHLEPLYLICYNYNSVSQMMNAIHHLRDMYYTVDVIRICT